MPPRKKGRSEAPVNEEGVSSIKNLPEVDGTKDFDNLSVAELTKLLVDAGVACNKFKKKADYVAALRALTVPSSTNAPPSAPQAAAASLNFRPADRNQSRGRSHVPAPSAANRVAVGGAAAAGAWNVAPPPDDDRAELEFQADAGCHGADSDLQTAAGSRLRVLLENDGSDDDDGPHCLADILPAPQRAKLNAPAHKVAMFIMTPDVQLLFSSMERDTLKKGAFGRKAKGYLDAEAQRIMGQANLEFAMGNFEKSKELCLRVVQLQPHSTQPYSTLSSIYESSGDIRRATDYLLCAAVVKPRSDPHVIAHFQSLIRFSRDAEIWTQLANKFQALGQLKNAIHCLRRASSNRRDDMNLLWMRYELQSQHHIDGQYRMSLDTLETILRRGVAMRPHLPLDPVVKTAALRLAFEHHKNNRVESAASVLRVYVQAAAARNAIDYDACNLLAECMVVLNAWEGLFEFLSGLQNSR